MKWIKPQPHEPSAAYYITSECGRYRINKTGGEPIYQAVRIQPQPSVIVLGRGTLDECKRACGG